MVLTIVPLAVIFFSIFVGRYPATVSDVVNLIGSKLLPWIQADYPTGMDTAIRSGM